MTTNQRVITTVRYRDKDGCNSTATLPDVQGTENIHKAMLLKGIARDRITETSTRPLHTCK